MKKERAFRFGRSNHLVGVVGVAGMSPSPASIGIVVLNAGLVHRIGPFRLHVEMTRRLNARGYPTLRFDLSTLGDSGACAEAQSNVAKIRADTSDAIDLLCAQTGCSRVVLIGLCSGAEHAHMVACTNDKVAGTIFLDGYIYRTAGFFLRHYLPRIFDPERWLRFVKRHRHSDSPGIAPDFSEEYPPKTIVRSELREMLARGLKMFFVYSGGISRQFNHERQFRECFGGVATSTDVAVEFLAGTDHTYTLECDRRRLFDSIERWLAYHFPPAPETRP